MTLCHFEEIFSHDTKKVKIFCTLGSSGSKEQLIEIKR
jgi:hypothetical protein